MGVPLESDYDTTTFTHAWLSSDRPRSAGEEPILTALTDAMGRSLNTAIGWHMTRLAAPVHFGDTEVTVETTLHFPDAGRLSIGGRYYRYTGREPNRFVGVTPEDSYDRLWQDPADPYAAFEGEIPVGELVLDWSRDYSWADRARQSAFVVLASGPRLDKLGSRYGLGRPRGMDDGTYREVLLAIAYKERSIWQALYIMLRAILRPYRVELTGVVGDYDKISGGGVFQARRWMTECHLEKDGLIHRVRSANEGGNSLIMSANGAPWFSSWTPLPGPTVLDAELFPFRVQQFWPVPAAGDHEGRMIVRIIIFLPPSMFPPGTYLQDPIYADPPSQWQTPVDWPVRGFLLDGPEVEGPDEGTDGWLPLYLSDTTPQAAYGPWFEFAIKQVLPTGTRLEMHAFPQES